MGVGFWFVFGLCIGSFINCLVYRLNHGVSFWKGRSFCPRCKHQLVWKDNIPVLSFLWLRGRCRYCHSPISWHYPLVELTAGILTLVFFQNLCLLFIIYLLLGIFVSDLLWGTIPDELVILGIIISLLFLIWQSPSLLVPNLFCGLGAAAGFLALFWITKGRGMGLGDVKLVAFLGLFLGWPNIIVVLFLAFLTGALMGVILILLGRKRFGQTVPFGPFLCLAGLTCLFWGDTIFKWYLEKILS